MSKALNGFLRFWRSYQYPTVPPAWVLEGTGRTREEVLEELGNPVEHWIYLVVDMDERKMWFDVQSVLAVEGKVLGNFSFAEGTWRHITCRVDGVSRPIMFIDAATAISSIEAEPFKAWLAEIADYYEAPEMIWEEFSKVLKA